MVNLMLGLISAYLLGSIPTSYIIGKLRGVDVRKEGSGNVGATNVFRVVGKLPALITLIVDILKGVLAVSVVAAFFIKKGICISDEAFTVLMGLAAIAGHNWTVFLGFKGGKGVATSCGVLMAVLTIPFIWGFAAFIIALILTKYVSFSSLVMLITVPIVTALMGKDLVYVLLAVTICLTISYTHKSNIRRLLEGKEYKIGADKS